jgi:hypothetical protein
VFSDGICSAFFLKVMESRKGIIIKSQLFQLI